MIRDRGKKKWTAFMMPEHISFLRQFAEDDRKQKKPELDEQELEDINIIMHDSLNYTLPIKVQTWRDGYYINVEGIVEKIDYLTKTVSLLTNDDEIKRLSIEAITKTERI